VLGAFMGGTVRRFPIELKPGGPDER
jgi:hypothetical protein